jgi:hypothetical protein
MQRHTYIQTYFEVTLDGVIKLVYSIDYCDGPEWIKLNLHAMFRVLSLVSSSCDWLTLQYQIYTVFILLLFATVGIERGPLNAGLLC